jgi:hypothetical protein
VTLYQVRFEDERLSLALRGDEVYTLDPLSKLYYLRATVARLRKVAGDARADVLRLADVDHVILYILEDINA